ncbi:HD domain-containing protein [Actinosynnema pretiosum subsp. pretiosum]|uniref:HD domain-containing protein n=1 Tax=Actinosynnema pretiosum subsp. pretiosum TaxID=103721 RepID=A0AA45LDP8_9PSEU|nr:HD domain-containing protein [Actinosynnema pretiosum subsp. pretiosum]
MELVASAYSVAEELLSSSLPRRWAHVQGVAERAKRAAGLFDAAERDLLVAAAVLHDVGYAPDLVVTGFHPLDGARYLQEAGFPARMCALIAHHSCAYREADIRGLAHELESWDDEAGPLRDALWWADMTTTPEGGRTGVAARIAEIRERYGEGDIVTRFISEAEPELAAAVERTEKRLANADLGQVAK